jgi:hypothetical protein
MTPKPSSVNRLAAPVPYPTGRLASAGWIVASALLLVAAYFAIRNLTLSADAKIQHTSAELAQIEVQSLKQQLFAERIVSERQISDLAANTKSEPYTFIKLTPPEPGAKSPMATIAWQPIRQAGMFLSDQLQEPSGDDEYRIWIVDSAGASIGAGTITISPTTSTTTAEFKASQPVSHATRFTVTRQPRGSDTQPSGPIVLSGSP